MATDTKKPTQRLTVADLCQAIATDEVTYTLHNGEYQLSGRDVRRLQRGHNAFDIPLELLADAVCSAPEELGLR
jgi:hypothetical protein